jgi:hypothetical protein
MSEHLQGVVVVVLAALTALCALVVFTYAHRRRKHYVVRRCQVLLCRILLLGCTALAAATMLHLEAPTAALCIVRPLLQHLAITVTLGCMTIKVRLSSFLQVLLCALYCCSVLRSAWSSRQLAYSSTTAVHTLLQSFCSIRINASLRGALSSLRTVLDLRYNLTLTLSLLIAAAALLLLRYSCRFT